jgi:tetratricopeptide (TPR) repeat protein
MSTSQEHEIVPAIRDWLAATSDVEIATGLSRDEARRRARDLLAAIAVRSVAPDHVEADDDDLKDVLWAVIEELDEKPLGTPTFAECDRVYQFVGALSLEGDLFEEVDDVLHRVARIGWRSSPGGLETILKARAAIWEHGDEQRHREICESIDQVPARIGTLRGQRAPDVADIRETCARLVKLANIRPRLVAQSVIAMEAFLADRDRRIGWLDDREYLRAATALAAGMTGRQLGGWDLAESGYRRAVSAFRRTADTADLDRVEVERLALTFVRGNNGAVKDSAPARIEGLTVPRERVKAQLIFANALINLAQPEQARLLLEAVQQNHAIENEPALKALLLTMLGTALSYLGKDAEAIASFNSAGSVLARFFHPLQLGALVGALGEHLAKLGELKKAIALYEAARETFREVGQAQQVGYFSVLRAELLMLTGASEEAEDALLAALPLIEKFDLQREGLAAVALLREAMTKRRTDVKTIQTLRGQMKKGWQ